MLLAIPDNFFCLRNQQFWKTATFEKSQAFDSQTNLMKEKEIIWDLRQQKTKNKNNQSNRKKQRTLQK